eukprot:192824_1
MSSTQILCLVIESKTAVQSFERLGYERFMSYLLNGYIIRYKNKQQQNDNKEIYVPKDVCKIISLYTTIINDLIKPLIKSVGKLSSENVKLKSDNKSFQRKIDLLAGTLERQSQSLLDALKFSTTLIEEQEPNTWNVNETAQWVRRLGNHFEEIANIFIRFGVDGEDLFQLNEKQIKSMNIKNVFLISKLLRKISEFK